MRKWIIFTLALLAGCTPAYAVKHKKPVVKAPSPPAPVQIGKTVYFFVDEQGKVWGLSINAQGRLEVAPVINK